MQEQFVTYEIAKKLKELGFKEKCIGIFDREGDFYFVNNPTNPIDKHDFYYNQECIAPMWQQVIDWFREKHNIIIETRATASQLNFKEGFNYYIWNRTTGYEDFSEPKNCPVGEFIASDIYKALDKGIEEALKLI